MRAHIHSAAFKEAWFHASISAKTKALYTERSIELALKTDRREIVEDLPMLWEKIENDKQNENISMSIASLELVVKKVCQSSIIITHTVSDSFNVISVTLEVAD